MICRGFSIMRSVSEWHRYSRERALECCLFTARAHYGWPNLCLSKWETYRMWECDCSLYLFCHNLLQSQPEFTLAGRSYQCTSSTDPCLPTSTFDCWTTSVEHISHRRNTLLQPFRLRGSGCLRFLLSSNRFVFVFGVTDLLHTWSARAGLSLTLRIHCLTSNVPCKPNGWRKCLLQMRSRVKVNSRNQ